jgi:hypothetical protein
MMIVPATGRQGYEVFLDGGGGPVAYIVLGCRNPAGPFVARVE